jgi:hypothetical protein
MFHRQAKKILIFVLTITTFLWCNILFASVTAIGISQGYTTTDKDLQVGMIAALSSESTPDKQIVERGSTGNASKIVGVITTIDANLLTLTSSNAQVHVTTSGEANVYTSDLNGTIKKGDFITASPLKGVAMRAGNEDTHVLGVALEDFNADKAKTQTVKTNNNSEKTVLVATIQVDVQPRNLASSKQQNKQASLVILGESLTGKSVSSTQVIVALIIFFLLLLVEGSIIYGAIFSTITALGRNPLARSAVYKQLLQVAWLTLVILAFGLGSIYAILWI